MAENPLIQARKNFKIPENIVIAPLAAINLTKNNIKASESKFNIPQDVNIDPVLYTSPLGTPVYADITFLAGRYETNTKGVYKEWLELKYAAVLITVTQAKKIIKTEIQGRDGTVKEYIGMDDYVVQVNGVITGSNGQHPADEIANLNKMLVAPIPVDVACAYLQNLNILSLVVESIELAQDAGGRSYQSFSLTCVSDIPQELRITNV
jgi:hypothetical protein